MDTQDRPILQVQVEAVEDLIMIEIIRPGRHDDPSWRRALARGDLLKDSAMLCVSRYRKFLGSNGGRNMIDVVLCIRRRGDISEEDFHRYWREEHAKLVASHAELLGMTSYIQHHTLTTGLESIVQEARGCASEVYDGIAVIGFKSLEDMAAKGAEPSALAAAEEMTADEGRFIDHANSRIWFTERHVVV